MDVIVEGKKHLLHSFFLSDFLPGSKLMLMEMSPLLYDFAIDVSKQVCKRFIFNNKTNFAI